MLQQFINFIRKHKLTEPNEKLLLAISGGLDSMVMLHLFHQSGFKPAVAHCNFQLRAEASDADAAFVEDTCKSIGLPFFVQRFNTNNYATEKGLSIQMAARELRYAWFNELMEKHGYNKLATAHHLNDNLETVLLNFTKGTGIDGLCGIPLINGHVIRPLLFASRQEIEAFANAEGIKWREDISNQSSHYQRNFLRLEVIPMLKKINPDIENTFMQNQERLQAVQLILEERMTEINSATIDKDNARFIPKDLLKDEGTGRLLIWELLKVYGFNWSQAADMYAALNHTGAIFNAGSFQVIIDREQIVLTQLAERSEPLIITEESNLLNRGGYYLSLEKSGPLEDLRVPVNVALLDYDLIQFPLTWRNWEDGDRFMPLGMQGMKKLSDFLIDVKLPLSAKSKVSVLEDASGKIVWLVGLRIDERVKVSGATKSILKLQLTGLNLS